MHFESKIKIYRTKLCVQLIFGGTWSLIENIYSQIDMGQLLMRDLSD